MSDAGKSCHYRPDTCRLFFSSTCTDVGGQSDPDRTPPDPVISDPRNDDDDAEDDSADDDADDVAFIDTSHLSNSPPRHHDTWPAVCESSSEDAADIQVISPQLRTRSCCLRQHDVIATSPAHQLEFQDSSYFYDDGAFVEITGSDERFLPPIEATSSAARVHNYLTESSKSRDIDRLSSRDIEFKTAHARTSKSGRKNCSCPSVPEEGGDSGYADSSTSTDYRQLTSDMRIETGSVDSLELGMDDGASVETAAPSVSGRLLSRKQFHRGSFVRYRYPAKFHRRHDNAATSQTFQLPPCLRPAVRYDKQPVVQKQRTKTGTKGRWPETPQYPPRTKNVQVECEILKLVNKLDIGVQCTPPVQDANSQCTPACSDVHTQCTRVKKKSCSVQTVPKSYTDCAIQNTVQTRSRMVDTDVTVTYYPNELPMTSLCVKCRQEADRCNVNYWVNSDS